MKRTGPYLRAELVTYWEFEGLGTKIRDSDTYVVFDLRRFIAAAEHDHEMVDVYLAALGDGASYFRIMGSAAEVMRHVRAWERACAEELGKVHE
jgi:xanthine/CO dehydrogenase XdhC/CoxF family maturation factor